MSEIPSLAVFVYQNAVLFGVFAFMGWLLETAYRSFANRRFVNAGYLYGPFLPIYGAGGILIVLAGIVFESFSFPVQMMAFAILTTALELCVGIAVDAVFGHRLWSYEGYWMNFRGIICPRYSAIWAVLSWVFYYFIFPLVYYAVSLVPDDRIRLAAAAMLLYFIADFTVSTLAMLDFFRRVRDVYVSFAAESSVDVQSLLTRFSRIVSAFPDLNRVIDRGIQQALTDRVSSLMERVAVPLPKKGKAHGDQPRVEPEYLAIVKDILDNEEFRKLANFRHHSTSILEHVQFVSYVAYRIAKSLGLDYRSAARGGLLHDFFLYDWHNHDEPDLPRDRNHGLAHPGIALRNARKHFHLNRIEEDIILRHMWPFTPVPPRFKESYVVTLADKYSATKEYSDRLRDFLASRVNRTKRRVSDSARKIVRKTSRAPRSGSTG